ncbi:hypothetical protein [Nonomuraea sp. NPDC049709]|uniref:hypothetical protein n=1 Tax=Nonomuraea sp. NPDC049709 TaxID=3154736 RepID=UPI00344A157B
MITRLVGEAIGGVGAGLVYVALGLLLMVAAIPLAVAGTAVLAIKSAQTSLASLMYATNRLYEEGLYFTDFTSFLDRHRPAGERSATAALTGFRRIAAEDITFSYPGCDTPALRGGRFPGIVATRNVLRGS